MQGKPRNQVEFTTRSMDETIELDNEVRLLDDFVDSLKIEEFGFRVDYSENGRPAYHPADLLKLYIYGYLNRTRSSRELEKECRRNLEVIWLMKGLTPDHNTIHRFRKNNPAGIKAVFESTVKLAKHHNLIGGRLLAGDGTKLRAQNSKKNNFNEKKINRHLEYIDQKLEAYNKLLAESDGDLSEDEKDEVDKHIKKHENQRKRYENLQKQLDESEEDQVSTSDPESRQMIIRGQITEVAYNVQSTVDAKHNLPIDYEVTNRNDSKAMGRMVERAAEVLGHTDFTGLFDKGYHTGSEFERADELGVEVIVGVPAVSSHAPNPDFDVEHFKYNPKKDRYTCPAGKVLRSNGNWYRKSRGKSDTQIKQYKTSACNGCALRLLCTKNPVGRIIERSSSAHLIEQNRERIEANMELYRQRQAIVEHPFGTMKRQWGFDHILTKNGLERAAGDVGLMFIAYNLRRLLTILPREAFTGLVNQVLMLILRSESALKKHINQFLALHVNFNSYPKLLSTFA